MSGTKPRCAGAAPAGTGAARLEMRVSYRTPARTDPRSIIIGWMIVGTALPLLVLIPPFSTFQPEVWVDGFANPGSTSCSRSV